MNGKRWNIKFVDHNDPMLVDRTGLPRLATTDSILSCIFISQNLLNKKHFSILLRVLVHELGHCALYSYNLLDNIHDLVNPEYWIDAEEWICNLIADYAPNILSIANNILNK